MRDDKGETVTGTRRGGLKLWRLLPGFGLVLLAAGNVRHGLAGHGDADGARTIFFALFLAGFVALYGSPPLFGAGAPRGQEAGRRRERGHLVAAAGVAALATLGAAAFSQAGWLGLWTPVTRSDWLVVALDLAAAWLYLLLFHAAWAQRGEADRG